jgi:ADP-ribose pyrophosphatase YjhB (NUDIX family)
MTTDALHQVTVFATRSTANGYEILVAQRHGQGMQLPVGIMQPDEQPEDAALRLMQPLTSGLWGFRLVRLLAQTEQRLEADERVVTRPMFMRTLPARDATLMRFVLNPGVRVRVLEEQDEFARAVYEEYELRDGERAMTLRRAGWLPADQMTDRIVHHLVQLAPAGSETPERWTIQGADAATQEYAWLPLDPDPELTLESARLLAQVRGAIITDS